MRFSIKFLQRNHDALQILILGLKQISVLTELTILLFRQIKSKKAGELKPL